MFDSLFEAVKDPAVQRKAVICVAAGAYVAGASVLTVASLAAAAEVVGTTTVVVASTAVVLGAVVAVYAVHRELVADTAAVVALNDGGPVMDGPA
jgi:hypothetical protein